MPTSTQIQEGVQELLNCDVVVRMQSDAMTSAVPFGALCYGKRVPDVRQLPLDDEIYIVKTKSKRVTVGRLNVTDVKSPRNPRLHVFYDDRAIHETIEIEQIGDVYLVSFIQPKNGTIPHVWETEG